MALPCPSCQVPMDARSFAGAMGREVVIDLCHGCNAIWFDDFENIQLAPAGMLALFEAMHRERTEPRPLADRLTCPRCRETLLRERNMVKSMRFTQFRCRAQRHGQLVTFYEVLREKRFIVPLPKERLDVLRDQVRTVSCSNYGAPVDLQTTSTCTHCQSPLALLDPEQVGAMLASLHDRATEESRIDPEAVKKQLAHTAVLSEFSRIRAAHEPRDGLVETALGVLVELLGRRRD